MKRLSRFWRSVKRNRSIGVGPIRLHFYFRREASAKGPKITRLGKDSCKGDAIKKSSESPDDKLIQKIKKPARRHVTLIVGAGPGLGSAIAKRCAIEGHDIALVARNEARLDQRAQELSQFETSIKTYSCDATREVEVSSMMDRVCRDLGTPGLVIYNIEEFVPGSILDIEASAFEDCWRAMTFGGFLVGREAARQMVSHGGGTIIYTGATASMRGNAGYINMAVGKFGIRALSQCMARELGPKGIHVSHIVLDGEILSDKSGEGAEHSMSAMSPESIADTILHVHTQHQSTWSHELDLRPWVEPF